MTRDSLSLLAAISATPVFRDLPSDELRALGATARLFRCSGQTLLNAAGQRPKELFLVVSGLVQLTTFTRGGQERVVGVLGPGQVVTWLSPFAAEPPERDWRAADGTEVVAIPIETFRAVLDRNPVLYPPVIKQISDRFRIMLRLQDQGADDDRGWRVGQVLLALSRFGEPGVGAGEIHLTGEKLGHYSRSSRQTVHVVLKRLRTLGLVEQRYGRLIIPDRDALADYLSR